MSKEERFYCRKDLEKKGLGYYNVFLRVKGGKDPVVAVARMRYTELSPLRSARFYCYFLVVPDYKKDEKEIIEVLHAKMRFQKACLATELNGIGYHICKEHGKFKVFDCFSDGSTKEAASLQYDQRRGKCYAKISPEYQGKTAEILDFICREAEISTVYNSDTF